MNCPKCDTRLTTFVKIKHPSNLESWRAYCDDPHCGIEALAEGNTEQEAEKDFEILCACRIILTTTKEEKNGIKF